MCGFKRLLIAITWLTVAACKPAPQDVSVDAAAPSVRIDRMVLTERGHPELSSAHDLPLHIYLDKRGLRHYRSEAQVELRDVPSGSRWQLYAQELIDGGTLWINGTEIGNLPTSSEHTTVWFMRPYTFDIAQGVLHSGINTVVREWSIRENQITASRMHLGLKQNIEPLFDRQYLLQNTMAQVAFVLSILISLLMLGIYARNRQTQQYLYIGLSALGWGLLNLFYILPPLPAAWFAYTQFMLYVGISAFIVGGAAYMLHDTGGTPRWFIRAGVGWGAFFAITYLITYWVTDCSKLPVHTPVWHVGLGVMGFYANIKMMRAVLRYRLPRHLVTAVLLAAAWVAGIMDIITLQSGAVSPTGGYVLPVVAPLWFVVVCFILIDDFNKSQRAQQEQQMQMGIKLNEQKHELERLHSQERAAKEKQAAAHERSRIMQDMHDGLGSQLVSSLAMAQSGSLSVAQTTDLLRSCIDDLRLAIDTSSESRDSLSLALGNLRFRMQPRLQAAGLALHWNTLALPDDLPLPPQHQLPVLRIMQETITNTLKHAQARSLSVSVTHSATALTVDIRDDGQGFDTDTAQHSASGKGLNSLDKRARLLGAQLRVTSSPLGTHTLLVVPLDAQTIAPL
jgi:signal transduction histidine kinase